MLGRPRAPFRFWDPARPIYTHLRHLPGVAADRLPHPRFDRRRRLFSRSLRHRRLRGRDPRRISRPARRSAGPSCSAPISTRTASRQTACRRLASDAMSCSIASIIDKNARIGDGARLVNERNVEHADGDG